jgi:hypothetical protein
MKVGESDTPLDYITVIQRKSFKSVAFFCAKVSKEKVLIG